MIGRGAAIFGCAGLELSPDEKAFFRDYDPFGFIIFARNVDTPDQLRALTASLREAVGRDAPVLVDQEGGRVQRLRAPHWREWTPPLAAVAEAGADGAKMMALRAKIIAAELLDVGIDANCAPLADIASEVTHPFLRNRCYGENVARVTEIARAVADAYLEMGVLPVVKHFPGHGQSVNDTHLELPTVTSGRNTLIENDFAPFKALADLPMAMTAHIVFSAYDAANPATQSPQMLQVIRDEIGFGGLLMTDDLNMQALSGSLAERTQRSIAAGCDIALHCSGDFAEMAALADAVGAISDAGAARLARALAWADTAAGGDVATLTAQRDQLLAA